VHNYFQKQVETYVLRATFSVRTMHFRTAKFATKTRTRVFRTHRPM